MPASTIFISEMQKIHEEAKRALEKAAETNESPIRQKEMTCNQVSSRRQDVARYDQP